MKLLVSRSRKMKLLAAHFFFIILSFEWTNIINLLLLTNSVDLINSTIIFNYNFFKASVLVMLKLFFSISFG